VDSATDCRSNGYTAEGAYKQFCSIDRASVVGRALSTDPKQMEGSFSSMVSKKDATQQLRHWRKFEQPARVKESADGKSAAVVSDTGYTTYVNTETGLIVNFSSISGTAAGKTFLQAAGLPN
jgi:hypothetical protein